MGFFSWLNSLNNYTETYSDSFESETYSDTFQKNINQKEHANVIEWHPRWSSGAPLPQVFSDGHKVYLIYYIDEEIKDFDGSFVRLIDNKSDENFNLALVEFNGGTFRFGIANDEVFSGLPLWTKGLEGYEAHIIENSTWIQELKSIHKVHPYFNEENWANKKHFCFLFHDEIFEVIAKDFKIETFNTTFEKLASKIVLKMNK